MHAQLVLATHWDIQTRSLRTLKSLQHMFEMNPQPALHIQTCCPANKGPDAYRHAACLAASVVALRGAHAQLVMSIGSQ